MSFGIVGLISYIFIVAITIQNGTEELKKSKQNRNILAIIVGVSIITIHSLMDFDMSFLIIEMVFYMLIAIINKEDKIEVQNTKYLEIAIIVIFAIISIGNTLGLLADVIEDDTGINSNKVAPWISRYQYNKIVNIENNKIDYENKINYIKRYIKNEPYQYQNIMYEIMCNQIIKDINSEEDIQFLIDTWKNIKRERTYEIEPIQKRAEIMLKFSEELIEKSEELNDSKLKETAQEILEIIIQEYEENNLIILDYRRNREAETITKYKYEYYTDVYEDALELIEK